MANVTPEFRVVSGVRRVTAQQLRPDSLAALGVEITPEILDAWDQQDVRGDEWLTIAARDGGSPPRRSTVSNGKRSGTRRCTSREW